ncbi:MAG: hypothetical protein NT034_02600 [Candidatus Magasanikbacteria bacterium]|nr:hypothetical protein [Candidatus Magasanikbacteria bacterium]
MFYSPRVYWKDKWIWIPAVVTLLFQAIMLIYGAMYVRATSDSVFLHYNVVFGVDLIGEWWKVLYIPMSAFAILVANFGLSWWVYGEDKILSRFLTCIAAFLSVCLSVAFYLSVGLNI